MIPAGLAYGCIIIGKAIVFLHIEHSTPNVLRYHVTIPSKDTLVNDGATTINLGYTVIAQLVTFTVLASESEQYDKKWRNQSTSEALIWEVDYVAIERTLRTPRSQRNKSPEGSEWTGSVPSLTPKSHNTRSKRHDKRDDDDDDDPSYDHGGDSEESESTDAFVPEPTPSKSSQDCSRSSRKWKNKQHHARPYCTQACLLGLVRRSPVDQACPNAPSHPRSTSDPALHRIGRKKFRELVQHQLATTLDDHIMDLQIGGARGILFKIVLQSHGYTFVSKGTVDVFVSDLKHEGQMYRRLDDLQGTDVPVYLGNIDLVELKWYDLGLCVIHMMLLSYAGKPISQLTDAMKAQVKSFQYKLDAHSIKYEDLRPANIL